MGLFDKVKDLIPEDKAKLKAQAQEIATKLDGRAQELAKRDGKIGDLAAKAHQLLDKVDTDKTTRPPGTS
jgi:hypothetical protein